MFKVRFLGRFLGLGFCLCAALVAFTAMVFAAPPDSIPSLPRPPQDLQLQHQAQLLPLLAHLQLQLIVPVLQMPVVGVPLLLPLLAHLQLQHQAQLLQLPATAVIHRM
jgi:hypothetical protein